MKFFPWAFALSSLLLVACATPDGSESSADQTTSESSSGVFSSSIESSSEFLEGSNVLFSEFYLGSSVGTRAVEISNYGTEDIDLSEYQIEIYHGNALEPEYRIPLPKKTLEPMGAFVVAYEGNAEPVEADLLSKDLVCNGSWPLALIHNGQRVDTLGQIGNGQLFAEGVIRRKNERRTGRDRLFLYDWIHFDAMDASNLGNSVCPVSLERMNVGPLLTQEDFDTPYMDETGEKGLGGAVEVGLGSLGDGDTTTFVYPSELSKFRGSSFRYQNIDTPEVQHGNSIQAQPWGYAAKYWNNDILRSAKHIVIQSVKGGYLTETFGRMLGYVWYTNKTNPEPEDYRNLNFETVREGYSKVAFSSVASDKMKSDGVSYYAYFRDAHYGAEEKGIKVHGEKDPSFSYGPSL